MATVMIVAGESSGELYGSLLACSLHRLWPELRITGVGGDRMRGAGVELVGRTSDAFGLFEAVSSYRKIREAFTSTVKALKAQRPDVLVPIDYPDFNLKIGGIAKSLGIKILYYVSPQVWAWRRGRVKKIARLVDRMAVILPFEEEIYRQAGVFCEFVGHPVLEEIETVLKTAAGNRVSFDMYRLSPNAGIRTSSKTSLGFDPHKPLVSLLPGSRPSELKRHLPLLTEVLRKFRDDPGSKPRAGCQFCMPLSHNTEERRYASWLEPIRSMGAVITKGESIRALTASDAAIVTSGTATFQTALLEVPMAVIYKLSPLTYQLGKRIIRVKHISLANILAGREVVPELIQDKAKPGAILKELQKIISDEQYREKMISAYRKIKEPFLGKRASERVAEIIMEMAGK